MTNRRSIRVVFIARTDADHTTNTQDGVSLLWVILSYTANKNSMNRIITSINNTLYSFNQWLICRLKNNKLKFKIYLHDCCAHPLFLADSMQLRWYKSTQILLTIWILHKKTTTHQRQYWFKDYDIIFHSTCAETATFLLLVKIWRQHHFANQDFVQKWWNLRDIDAFRGCFEHFLSAHAQKRA